jgi:hypothetical protein
VVYNLAAVYSGLAAVENRDETEGIKRALTYLQVRHRDRSIEISLRYSFIPHSS